MAAMSITKNAILNISKALPRTPTLFLRRSVSFYNLSKALPQTSSLIIRHKGFHASEDFKRRQDFDRGVKEIAYEEVADKTKDDVKESMDETKRTAKRHERKQAKRRA
ncbi:hypothetical protein HAX54_047430 [Datura stramonium]|uniref:Uncharacterized protein n=1 Tax=Datura stramonium TaxID=4076 RepID=A0ABS8SSE5_DATST|nr:hypothetical protein [Datura stramonium]